MKRSLNCTTTDRYRIMWLVVGGSIGVATSAFAQAAGAQSAGSATVGAAAIAAFAAIVGAILSFVALTFNEFRRRANDRKIAKLNSELQQRLADLKRDSDVEIARLSAELKARGDLQIAEFNKAAERRLSAESARRAYEYDARKRLYDECEPLLFQLSQNARLAIGRVISLARAARQAELEGPLGVLGGDLNEDSGRGYYFRSTLYQILAPLCVAYLLQSKLTLRDVSLDRWIRRQYILSDAAYRAFTRDFQFAGESPVVAGYREAADRVELGESMKQDVYLGRLDNLIENVVDRTADPPRVITFGRFEDLLEKGDAELTRRIVPLVKIVTHFHPRKHPVFWRILLAQYYLFRAIRLNIRESLDCGGDDRTLEKIILDPAAERDLWWKGAPDEEVLSSIRIGYEYLARTLAP